MFSKKSSLCILLCACLASTSAVAQSIQGEQQKLATYQQELGQLETDKKQLEAELKRAKDSLEPLSAQAEGKEKLQLDKAAADLKAAQANYDADPSAENQARLKNEKFQHALAERKFKKANAKFYKLQSQVDELSSELAATNKKLNQASERVTKQKATLQAARAKAARAQEARAAEEQRLKAAAAQAEIERLKAELAEQKRLEAQRQAAAEQAKREQAKKAADMRVAEMKAQAEAKAKAEAAKAKMDAAAKSNATIKNTASTTAAANAAKPNINTVKEATVNRAQNTAPAPAPAATATAGSATSGVILLTDAAAVKAELNKLNQLLATPYKGKKQYNKILNVKIFDTSGKEGPTESHSLYALGHSQYKGDADLPAGDLVFSVGFNRWKVTLPASTDKDFEFIYDQSDSKQPRLIYYPKSLGQ